VNILKTTRQRIIFLLVVGTLLHFIDLAEPRSVIFDEVHFGKFISSYCCTGSNIFDIHPPHAKLLIAAAARIGGYDGNFDFQRIGEDYGNTSIFWIRFLPAVWGTLIPVAFLYLLMMMGVSATVAFAGALLLTLDNAFLLQTRVIALDGLLILSIILSIAFFLHAARATSWKKQIALWVLSGVFIGLSVGTKFTGLVSPFLLGVLCLVEFVKSPRRPAVFQLGRKMLWMAASFFLVYLSGWYLHFYLLDRAGPGDFFYASRGIFTQDVVNLHRVMFERNATISAQHHDASSWWQWPTMNRPIYYWQGFDADIYFWGNPIIWWGALLGFVLIFLCALWSLRKLKIAREQSPWLWFSIMGFLISYLPFVPVSRPLFLYHYLSPLFFMILTCLVWFDTRVKDEIRKRYICTIALIIVLIGFLVMSPVTFGFQGTRPWTQWLIHHFPKI
jgi:dolichyl-phosphate-mannose-protein mannosyltransferase